MFARLIEEHALELALDHRDMTQPCGGFKQSCTVRDKCPETLLPVSQTKSVWMHLG